MTLFKKILIANRGEIASRTWVFGVTAISDENR